MVNIPFLAMFFGLLGTFQLHLAKAMEKQGIEVFDQIKMKLIKSNSDFEKQENNRKSKIYILGMILHNSVWIWQLLGTSYGMASHVTSVFGLGLILLLIYSVKYLDEHLSKAQIVGAIILIFGTVLLGFDNLTQENFDRTNLNTEAALIFVSIFLFVGIISIRFALLKKDPFVTGILFGLFAGGCGTLDPVFKELGLMFKSSGQHTIIPSDIIGWVLFVGSFIVGFLGLAFTQWGFYEKAEATVLVPVYNSVYVTFPILLQLITFPNYSLSMGSIYSIILIISGIYLMQGMKKNRIVLKEE